MSTILVLGARGFIGSAIADFAKAAGHPVRTPRLDFARLLTPEAWQPHLEGVDIVVNAVGVLRDSHQRPMQAVHADAPRALFEACAAQGSRRVIHISALGIDGNSTRYAQTKLLAERALEAHRAAGRLPHATVVRPSIVFGPGGASSRLFMTMARLPLLPLPAAALRTRVQPIAVTDLAEACLALIQAEVPPARVDAVGPEALTLAAFIATLRTQHGHQGPARLLPLPEAPSRWSARLGDHLPWQTWCSETLALLQQDNVGDAAVLGSLLGRPPVSPHHFVRLAWPRCR